MTRTIQLATSSQYLRPLTFDRANRGRPIKSTFPLFRLPIEVLQDVAPHIPSLDLETLAFVDRDCRQLARSVQFSNVRLTFNDASLGLLETLLAEVQARDDLLQALGPCIRHLTIDLGSPMLTEARLKRYPNLFNFHQRSPESHSVQDTFLGALAIVLSHSLPNLQSLNWQSRVMISTELMQGIIMSKARDVAINYAFFDLNLDVFDFYDSPRWLIEKFVLDAEWMIQSLEDLNPINVTTDILRAVSPTLQSLSWKGTRLPLKLSFGRETVIFPRLRALRLDAVPMADDSILSSFLSFNSRIISLEVSSTDRNTAEFLGRRGHLETLESFSWLNQHDSFKEEIICFLEANCQLRSLSIAQSLSPTTIDTRILPVVKSSFLHLTSLHLVWDAVTIPESSLSVIGSLHRLRRLWISAGAQLGWCNNWKIEHDVMLHALRPLRQLEFLTFSRDSYEVNGHPLLDSSIEKYYFNAVFPCDVNFYDFLMPDERYLLDTAIGLARYVDMTFEQARSLQTRLMKAAWERWHQHRMLKFAEMYANTFVQLIWCNIGQYPIKIERTDSGAYAIVESPFRENLRPL
ncbi:hypothetical protein DFH05DRAFT_1021695 [Lentinula detonsa]|uniref:F-box domain-containing protein n=1 Tax=Lentinula detonsa TaxID=2804962 RepID=A0A9W8P2K6_9AGAR|nr:hypothetical protein DFH05DRAFT_1021695 [Lentinula detonsa]